MLENYYFKSVKGMKDVFPEEAEKIFRLETLARQLFGRFYFGEIKTPVVEHTVLFERGVGQGTDIVNKEMFYVPAKDQDEAAAGEREKKMVLRPEATASVVRAYVEHEIHKKNPGMQRYYYIGSMFRYERPQKGRYRQFSQIGIELLGSESPLADGEAIVLLQALLSQTGLHTLTFQINAVGCPVCRPAYIEKLRKHSQDRLSDMCEDCKTRVAKNPLRLFDCKKEHCRAAMRSAPSIQEALCEDCRTHQGSVLRLLEKAGIRFSLEPRLMRGLDYYTKTVFEVVSSDLGAQNAVAAGGRYDGLVRELGGPKTSAIGWSLGVERLLALVPADTWEKTGLDFFVVSPGNDLEKIFLRVLALRRAGCKVGFEHEARSMKALFKKADRARARFALMVSTTDSESVEVKNMQTGEQFIKTWEALPSLLQTSA
ncbi:histidine--tRNA ligase [bacterium]|nr:histidine--tRNA ligase [bacterium]